METTRKKAIGPKTFLLGITGALAGGVVGHFLFGLLSKQGFYAMILPGALAGIGCGLLSNRKAVALGVICAVLAIPLCLFTEWRFHPFREPNEGLGYFLTHLHQLDGMVVKVVMMLLGIAMAYWFGTGRDRRMSQQPPPAEENDSDDEPR